MEIFDPPSRSGSKLQIINEIPDAEPFSCNEKTQKNLTSSLPHFPVAFSTATRLSVGIWVCLLVVSCGILLISVDMRDVHDAYPVGFLAALFGTMGLLHVLFLVTIVPSGISIEHDDVLVLRASPCCYAIYRFSMNKIRSVKCIRFRDVLDRRFIGFPTDLKKCVLIEFMSGWNLLISLEDPQGFVALILSMI